MPLVVYGNVLEEAMPIAVKFDVKLLEEARAVAAHCESA
jgi:hypothetical protein